MPFSLALLAFLPVVLLLCAIDNAMMLMLDADDN